MFDILKLKPCPKCGRLVEYNSYLQTYYCDCGYYEEYPVVETVNDIWVDNKEQIDKMIFKTLEK